MKYKINYPNIPELAVGFTRSNSLIAKSIQIVRGGFKGLEDKAFPNHAFIVTSDRNQLFATEETFKGLQENSLEQYTKESNRIVAMYYWKGWEDDKIRNQVLDYLAEIRRRAKEDSKYDFKGLFTFVPIIKNFVKPDPKKQWCSENVASIHKKFGCKDFENISIAPDQLLNIIQDSDDWEFISYYIL